MTDRRRNFIVLVLVGLLLGGSLAVILSKSTRQGLDLKGGVELVYQAKPTKFSQVTGDAIERTLEIMRERVDRLGVAEPEIQRSGEDQVSVSLPDVENQERAIRQVGTTAQMFFYDWETNVLGEDCQPAPTDPSVTGGEAAGQAGAGTLSYYDAVKRASSCPAAAEGQNTSRDAPAYYLLDDDAKRVVAGPEPERADLFAGLEPPQTAPADGQSVATVKPGTVVVKADYDEGATSFSENPIDAANEAQYYVLRDAFSLRGIDIKNPEQNFDSGPGGGGQPIVTFDFTDEGRRIWQDVTREIVQRGQSSLLPGQPVESAFQHFAVVLDNELITVPYIDFQQNPDGIDGRNGSQISGGFTITSAQDLANQLKSGALPIELELISSSQVSATLGQAALDEGLKAGIAGFLVVCLFLLVFYRVMGLIACAALVVYGIYFFALIKLIPITLTLPGIAGLILTIGVAADANIVIFERIKEEIRAGRSISNGISQGFKKGLSAIIDANVLVFLTAFILFILATAGVKGFAFVLGIGTLVSLFTAVLATQAVLGTTGHTRLMARPSALGAAPPKRERRRFDYMGQSRWFFSASGAILLVGALAIGEKGLQFGIDFESGTRIRVALEKPADENGVRAVLDRSGLADAKIQRVTDEQLGANAFQISTATLRPDQVTGITGALDARYTLAQPPDSQSVGPTFGNTVAKSAIIAIIASLLVISAYIALRFEWKYAVPVLIAVMHDILITAGVYSLTDREVTTATVAALLTILGFSLYDTIIVFDRIRENVPRMPRAAYSQIVNRSMNEVIVRSLATSFCTALPILALLVFGGETLTDFAFALIVGVLSGAYSSIFIASPVLTHWKEREHVYRTRRARIAEANGGVVPAYATGAAAHEVAQREAKRPTRRLTEPELPGQPVSQAEFQEMVRDLPVAVAEPEDASRDLSPDEVVMDKPDKPKRDKTGRGRNRRHGRRT